MNDDYLWDRSGEPDPEIARLESLLGRYRWSGGLSARRPGELRARRSTWLALAASLLVVIASVAIWFSFRLRWRNDAAWDIVHVIHASDGNLPSDMALGSPEGLEEERRLFYVALTRARHALHVYAPVRFFHRPDGTDDGHGVGKLSRFLTDDVRGVLAAAMTRTRVGRRATSRLVGVRVASRGTP